VNIQLIYLTEFCRHKEDSRGEYVSELLRARSFWKI